MNYPKKFKTYRYIDKRELDYLFIMVNEKCYCLIFNTSAAMPKKGNLERHFKTMHGKYESDYPANSSARKKKLEANQYLFKHNNFPYKKLIISKV